MPLDIPVAGTPLDPGLFSGKRRAPRTRRTLPVLCSGPGGVRVTGRTVDVSRGGMLLEMTDGEFRAPTDPSRLVYFATHLSRCFPNGLEVCFGEGAVRGRATIVRLVTSPAGATPILLGCRFEPPLATVDCALLGLDDEGDETEQDAARRPTLKASTPAGPDWKSADDMPGAQRDELLEFIQESRESWNEMNEIDDGRSDARRLTPAPARDNDSPSAPGEGLDDEDMRRVNQRAKRDASDPSLAPALGSLRSQPAPDAATAGDVVVHCFPAVIPFLGPRYRGRLVELRTRALTIELAVPAGESDPIGWAAGIGVETRVVCLRGGSVLWETRARVQRFDAVRVVDGPAHVRAVLLSDVAPSPSSRRRLGLLEGAAA